MITLFVYGTLKKNQYFNEQYLGTSEFLGPANCSKDFSLYIDSLPSLVKEPTDLPVQGELYQVSEDTLKAIDSLEDHPRTFKREPVETYLHGVKVMAWAYVRPKGWAMHKYASKESSFE